MKVKIFFINHFSKWGKTVANLRKMLFFFLKIHFYHEKIKTIAFPGIFNYFVFFAKYIVSLFLKTYRLLRIYALSSPFLDKSI